jgi:hypothetical protein
MHSDFVWNKTNVTDTLHEQLLTFMGLLFIMEAVFSWGYELRPKNHWPPKHFAFYEESTGSKSYLENHERCTELRYACSTSTFARYVWEDLYLLTHYTQQIPSWEANRFSACQEIPRILWNPKVHYRIHQCPPSARILSQLDPVHVLLSRILKIHLNIILPSTPGSSKWSVSLRFSH